MTSTKVVVEFAVVGLQSINFEKRESKEDVFVVVVVFAEVFVVVVVVVVDGLGVVVVVVAVKLMIEVNSLDNESDLTSLCIDSFE